MIKSWSDAAWEDFEYWMKQDKRTDRETVDGMALDKDGEGKCLNIRMEKSYQMREWYIIAIC